MRYARANLNTLAPGRVTLRYWMKVCIKFFSSRMAGADKRVLVVLVTLMVVQDITQDDSAGAEDGD